MHVVATAGHVDHGKSTLVRALTGTDPDRWAEERRRGMTLDLGYAWTRLPDGPTVAFVDVPGHERFVPTMLAGVGPVPAVLLVVAADEGWRRQSAEHLAVVAALGVEHVLVAVTRADLADPGPAAAAARAELAAAGLVAVDSVAVSAVTGAGLDELRQALGRLTARLPAPRTEGRVRLWVDRAFTIRGSGTVVTGTLGAGTLRQGDVLELAPAGRPVTVRGLQALGRPVPAVAAVARVAVNLRGIDVADVARGHALVTPGAWHTSSELDVRLDGEDPPPGALVLHVGAAAVPARVRPLAAGTARLRLATPLPLTPGDRAVLREPSSARAAGVLVLDVDPPALTRRGAARERGLVLARGDRPDVVAEVGRRGSATRAALAARGLLDADAPVPAGLLAHGDRLVHPDTWAGWRAGLAAALDAADPLAPGVPLEVLRRRLGLPDPALLAPLLAAEGATAQGGSALRAGTRPAFPPSVQAALDRVRAALAAAPFAAPERPDLEASGLTPAVLAGAERAGLLLRIAPDVVLRPEAPALALARLADLPSPFTLSQARQALGTTRRVAVPLLEHLDRLRHTVRHPDGTRVLGRRDG